MTCNVFGATLNLNQSVNLGYSCDHSDICSGVICCRGLRVSMSRCKFVSCAAHFLTFLSFYVRKRINCEWCYFADGVSDLRLPNFHQRVHAKLLSSHSRLSLRCQ